MQNGASEILGGWGVWLDSKGGAFLLWLLCHFWPVKWRVMQVIGVVKNRIHKLIVPSFQDQVLECNLVMEHGTGWKSMKLFMLTVC